MIIIEYVWCRPWTWVSTMFVIVRYIGLCWVMTFVLFCTSFIPGPLEVGSVIYQISGWAFVAFLSAADLVMILRVYAMWNRSKPILCILLFIYVLQTIVAVVLDGVINDPTHLSVHSLTFHRHFECILQPRDWSSVLR
ncbi:hypothetical protein L210DRAFT_3135880 [Boletus edulis BED1]|uniref:Uncharacterized protein n=1 Tax=Boletus edulis BED1 TaxID=1328754 RepID=A0AAD4BG51_BOLED|nr:hypothetical protein L210DRAFT_3135880 [Boletus edulis BED1]